MSFELKHTINPYYTHQPVLYTMLKQTSGPILELGCGDGSTELIHLFGEKYNRKIITVESNLEWMNKYKSKYENDNHKFIFTDHNIESWNKTSDTFKENQWGLVFIDQGFWEARAYSFTQLKNNSDYLILHDCDFFPQNNLLGKNIEQFIDKNNRGKRDYGTDIKYWTEYYPIIFTGPTGPPTLLASQKYNCNIQVDFNQYYVEI
jgi:hypothetical protein